MTSTSPAQKTTNDELKRAISDLCESKGVPAVPSKWISNVDYIEIGTQTVTERLEKMLKDDEVGGIQYGAGWIWWNPEENDKSGKAQISELYWDGIDPKDIPDELIRSHPLFESRIDRYKNRSREIVELSTGVFLIGAVIMIGDGIFYNLDPETALWALAALLVMSGLIFFSLGLVMFIGVNLYEGMKEKGVDNSIASIYKEMASKIPVSVSIEWKK